MYVNFSWYSGAVKHGKLSRVGFACEFADWRTTIPWRSCDEADRFSIRKRTLAIFHLIFTSRRVFREIYLVDAQHVFDSL